MYFKCLLFFFFNVDHLNGLFFIFLYISMEHNIIHFSAQGRYLLCIFETNFHSHIPLEVQIQVCIFSSFIVDISPESQGCHPITVNIGLDFFHCLSQFFLNLMFGQVGFELWTSCAVAQRSRPASISCLHLRVVTLPFSLPQGYLIHLINIHCLHCIQMRTAQP